MARKTPFKVGDLVRIKPGMLHNMPEVHDQIMMIVSQHSATPSNVAGYDSYWCNLPIPMDCYVTGKTISVIEFYGYELTKI